MKNFDFCLIGNRNYPHRCAHVCAFTKSDAVQMFPITPNFAVILLVDAINNNRQK